ncbi:MAG TPA: hypothetical protein VF044_06010 [Actinomycetota bacterium]
MTGIAVAGIVASIVAVALAPSRVAAATRPCFDDGHTFERRSMRGHLDGDHVRDVVWLGARRVRDRCRYFVFARTTLSGASRVRVPVPDRLSRVSLRGFARPVALVRIDAAPGKEVAVKLLEGASVRAFGVFTIRGGRLARLGIDDSAPRPLAAEDMFAFGGGLALMFGTDCAYPKGPATVVFSRASPVGDGSRYAVERRWYRIVGGSFVRTWHPVQRDRVRLARLRSTFPEFRNGGLLPRCDGRVLDEQHA